LGGGAGDLLQFELMDGGHIVRAGSGQAERHQIDGIGGVFQKADVVIHLGGGEGLVGLLIGQEGVGQKPLQTIDG